MASNQSSRQSTMEINRKSMMLMGVNEKEMEVILKKVEQNKAFSVSHEVRDMLQYLMFLALFIIVTVDVSGHYKPDSPYRMTAMLNGQLREKPFLYKDVQVKKTFEDIKTIQELHQYLTGPFYEVVYAGASFDGDEHFPSGERYAKRGYFGGNSRILGPIRIGQIRVKAEECNGAMAKVTKLFNDPIKCFNEYSASTESLDTFGYQWNYTALSPRPNEPRFHSYTHRWYGSPAFGVFLPPEEPEECELETKEGCVAYESLKSLKEHKYFDKATRAVFIDFNLYTPNIDHTTTVRLFAELLAGGGFATQVEFLTYRLYSWHDTADFVQLACEALIYCVILFQISREIKIARSLGAKYFKMFSNMSVLCNHFLFLCVLAFRVMSWLSLPHEIGEETFTNFRTPTVYFGLARSCQSFNCFLSWLKLFKFLSFIPMFGQLTRTVERAAGKVLELVIIFVLTLIGAALTFYLAFGNFDTSYHTFLTSFYTLLHIVTGEMSLTNLRLANRVLGPLFFIVFVFLMMFIILNIFIVIVSDAYTETKKELALMKKMELDTLSKEIFHHLIHGILLQLPIVGPYILQPLYQRTSNVISQANENVAQISRKIRVSITSEDRISSVSVPGLDIKYNSPAATRCHEKLMDLEKMMPDFLERIKDRDVEALKEWLNQFRTIQAQLQEKNN